MRPSFLPLPLGVSSENAAHRVAVCCTDAQGQEREGVYIPRRDTNSLWNHLIGGRLFPGEHHLVRVHVRRVDGSLDLAMWSRDGRVAVHLRARLGRELPPGSRFASLAEAAAFFAAGSVGYWATVEGTRCDGVCLRASQWRVEPLEVERVTSSFCADAARFPPGSVAFDCALLMRDIPHEWRGLDDLYAEQPGAHKQPCPAGPSEQAHARA